MVMMGEGQTVRSSLTGEDTVLGDLWTDKDGDDG